MGTFILLLKNDLELIFSIIIYILKCDFNFISLGQLQETGILYYDYPKYMIFKQKRSKIESGIRKDLPFILNILSPFGKVILIKKRRRLTYFLSKNP